MLNSPTIVLLTKQKSGVTQMRTCLTLLKQWSSDKDTAVSLEWNECQVYSTAKLFDGSVWRGYLVDSFLVKASKHKDIVC